MRSQGYSDSYESPERDDNLSSNSTNQAIVKSKDGKFYIMQIFMKEDEKLHISVMNRVTKERICTMLPIPDEFVNSLPNEQFDILEAT